MNIESNVDPKTIRYDSLSQTVEERTENENESEDESLSGAATVMDETEVNVQLI